jgi:glycosyltransferase involved in cell wall biosynthesis
MPDVQVRIVGIGPRLESLRRLADDLGLAPNLSFLGAVRDRVQLMRHYFEADLFCLPSLQEGFGIVFLEAMAAGLPIVAARAGATPEVVKENQVGLLFRPGDPGELSRLLARMLGDAELRCSFSAAALQRVEEYAQNKVASEFLRALGV